RIPVPVENGEDKRGGRLPGFAGYSRVITARLQDIVGAGCARAVILSSNSECSKHRLQTRRGDSESNSSRPHHGLDWREGRTAEETLGRRPKRESNRGPLGRSDEKRRDRQGASAWPVGASNELALVKPETEAGTCAAPAPHAVAFVQHARQRRAQTSIR